MPGEHELIGNFLLSCINLVCLFIFFPQVSQTVEMELEAPAVPAELFKEEESEGEGCESLFFQQSDYSSMPENIQVHSTQLYAIYQRHQLCYLK